MVETLPAYDDEFYDDKEYTKYIFNTGENKYVVKYFSSIPCYTCSCPDFHYKRRHIMEMCKHMSKIKQLDDEGAPTKSYLESGISCEGTFPGVFQQRATDKQVSETNMSVESASYMDNSHRTTAPKEPSLTQSEAFEMVRNLVSSSKQMMTCVDKLVESMENFRIRVET